MALHSRTGQLSLTIQDDGRGMPHLPASDRASASGLGLIGMEERVRELGGSLDVQSQPGKGTLDGKQAVDLVDELAAEVVVMDIAMPRLSGIDATGQITKKHSRVSVIILSMYSDEEYIVRALSAGAKGYLLKDSAEAELVSAVRSVSIGRPFFSPAIAQMLLDDYLRQLQQRGLTDSYELLSDREKEVIHLLAEGKTNKDVATILQISPYTVETHRNHIMQKLNLHNTAEIVLYAVRKKIIA